MAAAIGGHKTYSGNAHKMNVQNEPDVLTTVEEEDETPYVEYDISVSPSDLSLELIAQKIAQNDIIIPFYQRRYVWTIEQASKLVESFLMGLPVPQVFLYENDENQLEVIDGQQRLLSVKYFFEGYFGEADARGRRQEFRLKGLAQRSEYNGKLFSELSNRDQRKLKNSTLRAINIRQLKPSTDGDSAFHIFERLNTGGTRLKPQEIRNAVYRGNIVNSLSELNKNSAWQSILGLRSPDKNQKDVELLLRIFSLYRKWGNYDKPMITFLNRSMSNNRAFDSQDALDFSVRFPLVATQVQRAIRKPFRPRAIINAAVLEAFMVALLESEDISDDRLLATYNKVIKDPDFLELVTSNTTNQSTLLQRIALVKAEIADAS
ncbi:DUF262 domain-containing protein [Sandarakinorhabdus sp. DWP1-3-1]|uniref:DUF262 domain-containing protein n=1 Tax=Sandarakinorhabdus sp. DWP1-3-1 TaxID=2804627 RepID=UPI003CEC839F